MSSPIIMMIVLAKTYNLSAENSCARFRISLDKNKNAYDLNYHDHDELVEEFGHDEDVDDVFGAVVEAHGAVDPDVVVGLSEGGGGEELAEPGV